ncbi:cation/H(+) antiporter 3-like [Apium graveolens]|uniref:cation/H(+) antiporter 3-like n=1 Tax=Apium graveolens TaxID=4045 RepID=UPI003D79AAE6
MDLIPLFPKEFDENCQSKIHVHSPGLLGSSVGLDKNFLGYALTRLLLQLGLISFVTQSLHLLLRRFNVPRITSEILAGILLGKTVLRRIIGDIQEKMFPANDIILETFAKLGFIMFMFLVGVKMDPGLMRKAGRKGWTIGLVSSVFPIMAATYMSNQFDVLLPLYRRPTTKTIAGILTNTPFPVIVALLVDVKIMNSELGRLSLASALISDLTSTFFTVISTNLRIAFGVNPMIAVQSTSLDVMLVCVIMITRRLFLLIIKSTPEGKPVKRIYISIICAWVFASAIISDNLGLPYQFAPFLIGLTVPDGPPLGATITDRLETFVLGVLAPLMLTYSAIHIDVYIVYDVNYLGFLWVVIIILVVAKFLCVFLVALVKCVPFKEAVTLAFIMGAQGVVQAAFYDLNFKNQTIDDVAFSAVILSIFVVATFTHISVQFLNDYTKIYTGYQKRSIQHTGLNSELRVLTCIHRQDDALAAIKLLEASNPSGENPLSVYALHLVELVGRATPLFINHSLGQKSQSGCSRSRQLIDLLESFQHQHAGCASVQVFTAMSMPVFMYQDICSLAFDKLAALIVLPFHRKWNQHGKVVYDSNVLRTMNQRVVEMSPCSVGIYVDRRKIRHKTDGDHDVPDQNKQYQVAIIYLGGGDDREALAYGKRMMCSTSLNLTILRLIPTDESNDTQWDKVLDAESLKEMRFLSTHRNNVSYQEEKVKDGPETTAIIKAMLDFFDLILVGRRHKEDSQVLSGLWEWTDLTELGPIGDFLASADINKPVSVLVIQQQ